MPDRLANALTFASELSDTYGKWPRRKPFQRGAKVRQKAMAVKREHFNAGHGCEVCGWRPVEAKLLHAHHVIPLTCGGTDAARNTLVLCPNHHAVAHHLGKRSRGRYTGPETRDAMRDALLEHDKRGLN